jgi:predicted metalloprotease
MRTISHVASRLLLCSLLLIVLSVTSLSTPSAASAQTQPSLQAHDTFDLTAYLDPRGRELTAFTGQVAAHLNTWWGGEFSRRGYRYQGPTVQWVVRGRPATLCGEREMVFSGPAYMWPCYTVLLPIDWLAPFWIRGYDAMLVTVVAHEWSHHVTHILSQIEHSEREELRADCHAGMFLAWSAQQKLLEPGDLEEAVTISLMAGTAGHGTGQQRAESLLKGYNARGFGDCGREL